VPPVGRVGGSTVAPTDADPVPKDIADPPPPAQDDAAIEDSFAGPKPRSAPKPAPQTPATAAANAKLVDAALASLDASANFKNLDAATQAQVKALIKQNAGNPRAAQNIAALANSDGFAKLPPALRQQALQALSANPQDPSLEADLEKLAGNADFQTLNDSVKGQLIQSLGTLGKSPLDRQTMMSLPSNAGFRGLTDAEKTKLLNYVGGSNLEISSAARKALPQALTDVAGQPAAKQSDALRKFMKDQATAEDPLEPPPGSFTGKTLPYTLGKPSVVKNYAFASGKANALKYDVVVNGKHIPVYVPQNPPKGLHVASIDEIAKGLATLPAASRARVTSVTVNPGANPDDKHWAVEYKDPNFRSYMACGADGAVQVYPTTSHVVQDEVTGSMIHETGHALSIGKWGDSKTDKRWDPWKKAMGSDPFVASKYAKSSPDEDFAETLEMYYLVKGTPQEAEMRKLMPERFKIIDSMVAGAK
jgi:hypothetical protein